MIIDAHVHITENGKWLAGDYDASIEYLVRSLENGPVDEAVLLPINPFVSNEFIADACARYPDKLIGFASVNPLEDDALVILEKAGRIYNLKGLKLHPRLQQFQLDDPSVQRVIERAASLQMPVLIDTWIRPEEKGDFSILESITRLAASVPSSKIIVPHLGGLNYSHINEIAGYENLYFDISFILKYIAGYEIDLIYDEIIPLMKALGSQRLIYGSDHPEADIREYYEMTEKFLDNVSFSEKDRDNIYGNTFLSLGIK